MSRKLSAAQLRVLRQIHTGHGPMLWGNGHESSRLASAFHRTANSLRDRNLVVFVSDSAVKELGEDRTGYSHRLTAEGKAVLFSQPDWRAFRVLRDSGAKVAKAGNALPDVYVAHLEDRFEALLNSITSPTTLGWQIDTMGLSVPLMRGLIAAYGGRVSGKTSAEVTASLVQTLVAAFKLASPERVA